MINITLRELTRLLGYPETTIRKLLNDSGANISEIELNPNETINRDAIVNLWSDRAGRRESVKLSRWLDATRPE